MQSGEVWKCGNIVKYESIIKSALCGFHAISTKSQRVTWEEKDITLTLATNPGPPKGCAPFWNCKGWYTTTKGTPKGSLNGENEWKWWKREKFGENDAKGMRSLRLVVPFECFRWVFDWILSVLWKLMPSYLSRNGWTYNMHKIIHLNHDESWMVMDHFHSFSIVCPNLSIHFLCFLAHPFVI